MEKRDCSREPLLVILLTGLRASGKSLCGRALEDLLTDPDSDQCCKYLDLDESGENGPLKFKFFYEDCLKRMVDEGGTWILDKQGEHWSRM